ncbi:hypothetical protein Shal_1826 [Shewanella halifaxensis HAW-EB4]|uniref:Uncharacterized protein n=1 Tax=Shewanella halifaxensis (strain HAW-EB4) TaxID=458817 RepID=B0TRH3_SHEHH|nr:hypothetical protein [Shewanella halifaxensis]ABZ76391.1 hypothetical protein Shal_1826 [Shewanella halifaxensis HAW-EB4]
MRQITIDWFRLFRYSLLFIVFSMLMTAFMLIWFSNSLQEAWHRGLMLTFSEFEMTVELTLTLLIYISFPVLLFRFLYYFSKMLYRGRSPGVAVISYKTLFNPLNFLLFPSLLNDKGLLYRRRCLLALILLTSIYFIILFIT